MSRSARPAILCLLLLLVLPLTATLTGCGGHAIAPSAVIITGPTSSTIDPGDAATFTATVTGGPQDAGVTWTLTNCSATNCGTLSATTLFATTYTAPATVTTAFTVTLTGTSTAKPSIFGTITLSIPANPTITTTTLPGATFGAPYTVTLAGNGGITPYTFAITQGALPTGLTLSSTSGTITGTPTSGGTASFTVTLTDAGSPALTTTAAFTITTTYQPLSITTTNLPNGVEGTPYTTQLTATGGSNAYTWTVASGTALSDTGLTLSPSGAITGIPTTGETSAPVTILLTDSAGHTATVNLTLTVTAVAFQGQVLSGTTPVANATIQLYAAGSHRQHVRRHAHAHPGRHHRRHRHVPAQEPLHLRQEQHRRHHPHHRATLSRSHRRHRQHHLHRQQLRANHGHRDRPLHQPHQRAVFTINERTTAAAAWALAPFASSATTIGATATNTLGLTNAFLDAALLSQPHHRSPRHPPH